LDQPGDYSEPIRTNIGWHVIQLIEKKPLPEFDALKKEIKSKVKRDSRSQIGAKKFVNTLKRSYEFSVNERTYTKTIALVDVKQYAAGNWTIPDLKTDRSVATFADQELRQSTILEFWAKNQKQQSEDAIEEYLRLLFNVVSNDKIIAYEDSQLDVKYPDFRNLVREYREGILLFDLTQEEVWDKAAKDSVGIYDHYQKIKSNYTWDDRISYKLWVAQNERDAKRIVKWVSKQKDSKLKSFLTSKDALAVAVSSGTAQKKDDEVLQLMWNTTPGVYGPVDYDDGFAVIQVIDYLPSAPKALNEVKGLVIASYQNELEAAWVKSLEEKFDVSIDQAVKEKLFLELAD